MTTTLGLARELGGESPWAARKAIETGSGSNPGTVRSRRVLSATRSQFPSTFYWLRSNMTITNALVTGAHPVPDVCGRGEAFRRAERAFGAEPGMDRGRSD